VAETGVAPRVLLWGTPGRFADRVLQTLLRVDVTIVGVVLPGVFGTGWHRLPRPRPPTSDIPMLPSFVTSGLAESASKLNIPVFRADGDWKNTLTWNKTLGAVTELAPTVIVVACWHTRLPDALLSIPVAGGLNIHPSRLPAFRGPTPFFWQRRAGLEEGAVTIHGMVHEWDAGAIYAQAPLTFPEGATMEMLDDVAGRLGGELVGEVVAKMAMGMALPTPQSSGGSYQSFPHAEDFRVSTTWTARHAWNFMRVAESFGTPFAIEDGERTIVAHRALAFRAGNIIPEPSFVNTPAGVAVHFQSGVVVVA